MIRALSLTFGLLVSLTAFTPSESFAQPQNETRSWRGPLGIPLRAKLKQLDGETVHLEIENGGVVEIPLNALSEQDRGYIEQLYPDPFLPQGRLLSPPPGLVVVAQTRGSVTVYAPGRVLAVEDGKAIILIERRHDRRVLPDGLPDEYKLIWEDGEQRETSAELLTHLPSGGLDLLGAAAELAPPPLKLRTRELKLNEELAAVTYQVENTPEGSSFGFVTIPARATLQFRERPTPRTVLTPVFQTRNFRPRNLVIVDMAGEAVARTHGVSPQNDRTRGSLDIVYQWDSNVPLETLDDLIQPSLFLAVAPKSTTNDTMTLQFVLQVFSYPEPLRNLKLAVRQVDQPARLRLNQPAPTTPLENATLVELRAGEPAASAREQMVFPSRYGSQEFYTTYVGELQIARPTSDLRYLRLMFATQVTYQRGDETKFWQPQSETVYDATAKVPRNTMRDEPSNE